MSLSRRPPFLGWRLAGRGAFLLLTWTLFHLGAIAAEERLFTDTDGRTVNATVHRVDETHVSLRVGPKTYRWPLVKLSEGDQVYLKEWQKHFLATRKERLAKITGGFPEHVLTHRAYPKPKDYLSGELFESYLKRVQPQYTTDSLQGLNYKVEEQTAALFVPPNYDESKPFGVYVEVTASKRGHVPRGAEADVFAKHQLIYICPHGAGNNAILSYRMGLALDALATVKNAYLIDDKRCFVGGVSGGGISSTMICYLRPEHFQGAVNIVRGALLEPYTIEKTVKVFGDRSYTKGETYPPFLPHLKNKHTAVSLRYRDKSWAFVSGENDYNYEFAKASGPQWIEKGYRAKYFHVPGMGHAGASPETLDTVFQWMASAKPAR